MHLSLVCHDGLYYCPTDVFTLDHSPIQVNSVWAPTDATVLCVTNDCPQSVLHWPSCTKTATKARQLKSEVWLLRLGSPGVNQLNVLPQLTTGLPLAFDYHPLRFVDFKEQACIRKQATQQSAVRTTDRQCRFYMDFGFMRASASDYSQPDKLKDSVVWSYDGYSSYLFVIDEASRMAWIFLTASKEPPIDIIHAFLTQHGYANGSCTCTDQDGELA
jgi:hypothetical protein